MAFGKQYKNMRNTFDEMFKHFEYIADRYENGQTDKQNCRGIHVDRARVTMHRARRAVKM